MHDTEMKSELDNQRQDESQQMIFTRQQRVIQQQNNVNTNNQHHHIPLAQNSSGMNILSSNQSLGMKQSNGSSIPSGNIRHDNGANGLNTNCGNEVQRSRNQATPAKKKVKMKSIEIQVSPSLLTNDQKKDEEIMPPEDYDAQSKNTIGNRRTEKRQRRRRRSKKQLEMAAAVANYEKYGGIDIYNTTAARGNSQGLNPYMLAQ